MALPAPSCPDAHSAPESGERLRSDLFHFVLCSNCEYEMERHPITGRLCRDCDAKATRVAVLELVVAHPKPPTAAL